MRRSGVALALGSSLAFGTSGPFGRALLDAGWSPGAAVLVRVSGAALVLASAVAVLRRSELRAVLQAPRTLLVYGVLAVAGVQVCFFTAVQTLSVSVALLLEYLAPVLVVGFVWWRTGRRPGPTTLAGGALALSGTVLVLDVTGNVRVDPVGVLWALAAAVCLACYFLVLGRGGADRLDPVALAAAGLVVGAVVVAVAGLLGALPVRFGSATTELVGRSVPAWLPVLVLVLVSTVLAYAAGAAGLARLGATAGSVLGLAEVVFAVLASWLLLDQVPAPVQVVGAAVVVGGVLLAQVTSTEPDEPAPAPLVARSLS